MRWFKFVKESDNRWFVDLPEWEGDKDELEMVLGADTMLEIASQGEDEIELCISVEPFDNYKFKLEYNEDYDGGGWYKLKSDLHDFPVWLCHVTKFVFGEMPKTMYCSY